MEKLSKSTGEKGSVAKIALQKYGRERHPEARKLQKYERERPLRYR
ncbi:MAG: hypothetical protein HYS57_01580 [Parcubacteria group bacterium]|nr:hypothetical protein [Parcubacteria group bacterium]